MKYLLIVLFTSHCIVVNVISYRILSYNNINININNKIINSNYKLITNSKRNKFVIKSTINNEQFINIIRTKSKTNHIDKLMNITTYLFPLWVLLFSLIGRFNPSLLIGYYNYITISLSIIMLGMGMTLTINDFKSVFNNFNYVIIGFLAQYTIMPLLSIYLSKLFKLSNELTVGLVLVGCSPGGTASNIVTLIAQADVALSIIMTTFSTIGAIVMTPFLTATLLNNIVPIKLNDLILSVLNVVLIPVILGLFINTKFPKISMNIGRYMPVLSVLLVSLICGSVSASNSIGITLSIGSIISLIGAIVSLHLFGFLFGYLFAKLFQANESSCRTISIETGMQNSALASVLAQHFPNPQLSSLPGAFSATCHSIIGSLIGDINRINQNNR